MRITCPSCGAIASLEAWTNDAAWREFADCLMKFPGGLAQRVIPYLGLFRQGDRGLTAARAARLARDLLALVQAGTIHIRGEETRPAPVEVWAQGIEQMLSQRPRGLTNHNYLRKVVHGIAAPVAAKAERSAETNKPTARDVQAIGEPVEGAGEDLAPLEERQAVVEMIKSSTRQFGK